MTLLPKRRTHATTHTDTNTVNTDASTNTDTVAVANTTSGIADTTNAGINLADADTADTNTAGGST